VMDVPASRPASVRAAALSASAGLVLVVAAMVVPHFADTDVRVHWPPLHAWWGPRLGFETVIVGLVGLVLWWALPHLLARLPWGASVVATTAAAWVWTMTLALYDGRYGLSRVFERKGEYVYDAQHVHDVPEMLRTFIDRIPYSAPDNWHVHVAGHPPGSFLFFVLLDRLGVTDPFWIAVIVVTLGTTGIAAVMLFLGLLGTRRLARTAAPWLVLAPMAVWTGVSADWMFAAVAAWGLLLLALAGKRRSRLAAVAAGVVLGYCVYLSYGLVLLGIPALTVLFLVRSWRPLPWALAGAAVVTAIFSLYGFHWWEAYPVLRERYHDGIASERAYWYWVWADVAAWAFTAGLAVWAAFPRAWRALRERNPLAVMAAAAGAAIVVASLSGMSKAEVERIFLPFTLWIVALPALAPARWRSPLLLTQVITAVLVQAFLITRW